MSSTWPEDLISRIEDLDLVFTGMWSQPSRVGYGIFFYTPDMPNDIFFDKLAGITSLDAKALEDALCMFAKFNTIPYIYVLPRPDLERTLLEGGMKMHDVQRVLCKKPGGQAQAPRRVGKQESIAWSEVFCKSYDCMEWKDAVTRVVQSTLNEIEYYLDESGTSCVALYAKNSLLGLYCLGTVPEARREGHAQALVDFATSEAGKRGLDLLVLETYERDGLGTFYARLGFDEVYRKKVYTT